MCCREGLVFGFVGDFSMWNMVPYVIEDLLNENRKVYRFAGVDRSCNYVSFSSEFAISTHVIKWWSGLQKLSIVLYVPSSLIVSSTARLESEKDKESFKACNLQEESSSDLGKLYMDVAEGKEIGAKNIAQSVAAALRCKVLSSVNELKRYKNDCVEEQANLLDFIAELLRKIATNEDSLNARDIYHNRVDIDLEIVPVPLALTTQLGIDNGPRIVTFRLTNAADKLSAMLWIDMTSRLLEALKRGSCVLASVDLTHGVNYASASLLRAGLNAVDALSAFIQILDSGSVKFRFYNSDPVGRQRFDITTSKEAYKIHLVAMTDVNANKIPEGFVESFISRIPRQLGTLDVVKNVWKEYARLIGIPTRDDFFDVYILSVIAISSGLPFWAMYFASELVEKIRDNFENGLLGGSSLDILINSMTRVREKLANFKLKPRERRQEIQSYDIDDMPQYVEYFTLMLSALMNVVALGQVVEEGNECIELKRGRRLDLILDGTRIHNIFAVDVKNGSCFDDFANKKLNWIRPQSREVIRNELRSDEKITDIKVYGYMPGNIDQRNLLAHSGLSRGAAILLEYKPENGKKTLRRVFLADTDNLRSNLRRLWK